MIGGVRHLATVAKVFSTIEKYPAMFAAKPPRRASPVSNEPTRDAL